ncbi:MgtC/SapB family protein [Vagococcus xieshaowenii]|uniref:MgtC/SapB family protein n=1 Tax=Vagococcus xieshaowenii TaxID=2562451 RepID=A0AAJ5EEP2_9ENTE|nr:MgtC/SapB family protein [Vagococcus xieshaowenii]QCA27864.1 MgtC/SapB family protein [Vagococcus xieshaowenii]TFZ39456.1 MgtC/SapB family protein [Vagococcus xieshaowenii]
MLVTMDYLEITKRLLLAIILSGIIGFDREYKNRPAGVRTHILVAVGACVVALIQEQIALETVDYIKNNPSLSGSLSLNQGRLTAQVISGIGFLGAGTIMVNKTSVKGLTTAASIWAVACLGIAAGEGFYAITLIGFMAVILVLTVLERIIRVPVLKILEIDYTGDDTVKHELVAFLKKENIEIRNVNYHICQEDHQKVYKLLLELECAPNIKAIDIIDHLADHPHVTKVMLEDS